ncbi:MAG: methyl-accepting chemotaxis protein [Massilia sp.]
MKIRDMKIGQRLALGFGVVLMLLVAVIQTGFSSMETTNGLLQKVVDGNNVRLDAATDMRDAARLAVIGVRDVILVTDPAESDAVTKSIAAAWKEYDRAEAILDKMSKFAETRARLAKVAAARAAAAPLIAKAQELVHANNLEEANRLLRTSVVPAVRAWQAALNEMIDGQALRNKEDQAKSVKQYETARLVLLGVGASALLVAVLVGWLITRSITRPMKQAVQIAQTVAAGDLTSRIEVDSKDETGQLLLALKEMNASLQDIVSQVRGGTDTIATASTEIASGNLDLSSRTEEQASALEETASSMEELTSTVKQNADNARQANQLAQSASEVALRGGAVVADVVATMGSINDSAGKIVDIIGVIDGIAFQTNILALNAAVEAARAGEQGRGFAVVASEVRNLAQRSASAAKEIKALIGDSVDKVGEGSRLVNQAGATMDEIVTSVKRVTDIMGEITMASREQEAGIEQINQAIAEMDTTTQQNAALVEEAAAAAQSLQEQSGKLAQVVGVFHLDAAAQAARPAAVARKAAAAAVKPALSAPARRASRGAAPAEAEWETF